MKAIVLLLIPIVIAGCFNDTGSIRTLYTPIASQPCTTESILNGIRITCPDGTSSIVSNGINGTNGLDGSQGDTGPQGTPGINGTDGTNGTNGVDGTNGIDGTNGTNGVQGPQGIPGLNGQDGSTITTVKLCANDMSSFPEYGVKIGSYLYAVYWDIHKGAFLALLTPGNYISTNGTACTFTLHSDGTITQ